MSAPERNELAIKISLNAELYRLAEEVHKCAIDDEELVRECWRISREEGVTFDGSAIFELVKATYIREFDRAL